MWVVRDKYERLLLFTVKPIRSASTKIGWMVDKEDAKVLVEDYCMVFDGDLFPYMRWEDEPIELTMNKNNENNCNEITV